MLSEDQLLDITRKLAAREPVEEPLVKLWHRQMHKRGFHKPYSAKDCDLCVFRKKVRRR